MPLAEAWIQSSKGNLVLTSPINVRDDSNGYMALSNNWDEDQIELDLHLKPQRIKADERIAADRGRVALRYGPLIYCIESVDQNVDSVLPPDAPLTAEWRPDLLDGVTVIRGKFADGKPMLAIPYYARANRGGRYAVWIRDIKETDSARIHVSQLNTAINRFNLDVRAYPPNLDYLITLPKGLTLVNWQGPYLERVLPDPWGKPFQYESPGTHHPESFDVWTVDPVGHEIGNWAQNK